MRVPYVPEDVPVQNQTESDILARIVERRGSHGLLPLDRALLHSVFIADGWNTFLGSIRTKTSLHSILSELLICRVAVLNKASFEWDHHAPLLVEAGFPSDALHPGLAGRALLSASQLAALAYADQMTLSVQVGDDVFERLKQHYNTREIVEITATVSAYNCVSRFLVALDVDERAGKTDAGK
uniref:Uncharacterized protein YnjA n=1 Tax=Talaromyces marneffei PM1 TaxID=1077442 RepID=A0A093W1F5_TALMA